MSYLLIGDFSVERVAGGTPEKLPDLWWQLAIIISCGTLAAVLIPEFTKVFTSSHSKHVHEIVTASREGGASLTILSGIVAGNFSAFWKGVLIAGLMAGALLLRPEPPPARLGCRGGARPCRPAALGVFWGGAGPVAPARPH